MIIKSVMDFYFKTMEMVHEVTKRETFRKKERGKAATKTGEAELE